MNSITVTFPLPERAVSQNGRKGIWAKAAATKKQRTDAGIECLKATEYAPRWKRATLGIKAFFKDGNHPDPMNFIGSLKATIDGIEDAGIVEDDKGLWPLRPVFATDKENPRVELTITPEVEP